MRNPAEETSGTGRFRFAPNAAASATRLTTDQTLQAKQAFRVLAVVCSLQIFVAGFARRHNDVYFASIFLHKIGEGAVLNPVDDLLLRVPPLIPGKAAADELDAFVHARPIRSPDVSDFDSCCHK